MDLGEGEVGIGVFQQGERGNQSDGGGGYRLRRKERKGGAGTLGV